MKKPLEPFEDREERITTPTGISPRMDKAEGLVIDDQMHPWIGVDIKQTGKPNLFQLSPIETATS